MKTTDFLRFWTLRLVLGLLLGIMPAALAGCAPETATRSTCRDALGCVWVEPGEAVKLVSLQTFSGPLASVGEELVRTLELRVAEHGGPYDRPVTIVREDEQCSASGGLVAAQKIVTDPSVVAIHGPHCSSAAVPAARVLSEAGMVMVSGTATASSLTSKSGKRGEHQQPGFFRTASNDQFQGMAAASFAYDFLGLRRAATVHDQSPYASGLTEAFAEAFLAKGGEVVFTGTVAQRDRNMRPVAQAMAGYGPEFLFLPIFSPEAEYLIQAVRAEPKLSDLTLLSADSILNQPFIQGCGIACQGMLFIAPAQVRSPAYTTFLDRYVQTYGTGTVGYFHAHGYDAASILLHALEQASFPEPDGSLRIERQRIRDVLYGLLRFPGLTGALNCDAFGDCGVPRFKLVRLEASMDFEQTLNNTLAVYAP
ncbi:branched-chain amino acid ABC transporter substrate-binding protein [Desulfonatronum thiodismutans]|uniref:branched-chain amino acid ABC transporter substrate-binding protein n=1 Tax=Desulfonatronum thiodismutans TaxID=159290 RepID=UPI00137671FF|nr:branched-chain amino acid ABC transporter substrate-binding protein [Desulfonatronum thiodismutans]